MPHLDAAHYLIVALTGLIAGTLGSMLGVGGSVVMIPAMVALFGQAIKPNLNQHVYQAAAMIANIVVSVPAAIKYYKAGATHTLAVKRMLPFALGAVIAGVWLSDLFAGTRGPAYLGGVLAMILVLVVVMQVRRLSSEAERRELAAEPALSRPRCGAVGGVMGLVAGLTGVGGGAIAVPLQQSALKLPLKTCIANSSTIICVSATIGAIYKNVTLVTRHGYDWRVSLMLAALLAPTCWIGGRLGPALTQRLPVRWVRVAFILLLIAAIARLVMPVVEMKGTGS